MKKLIRLIAVCTLLLLAATPTFAAPPCTYCEWFTDTCELSDIPGERCRYLENGCESFQGACIIIYQSVLAEWDVTSVEVSHAADVKVATASAGGAGAPAAIAALK